MNGKKHTEKSRPGKRHHKAQLPQVAPCHPEPIDYFQDGYYYTTGRYTRTIMVASLASALVLE